jgi:hypothetical protein
MASEVVVREAGAVDAGAIASLRSLWSGGEDPSFEARMAGWLAAEGERRTTWLAIRGGSPVGMASMFEYRRMPHPGRPDSRWGYVSNMFVREELRDRGISRSTYEPASSSPTTQPREIACSSGRGLRVAPPILARKSTNKGAGP